MQLVEYPSLAYNSNQLAWIRWDRKRKENPLASIMELAESALLARQQLPAEFGPEAVRPSYDGLGLANAAALATHWLAPDAPPLHDQPALPPFQPELLNQPAVTQAWQAWQAARLADGLFACQLLHGQWHHAASVR